MTIEDILIHQYGPLLTTEQLANVLQRSPEGLRLTLRGNSEWVQRINATRLRLGRRVYFRTLDVAQVLGGESA